MSTPARNLFDSPIRGVHLVHLVITQPGSRNTLYTTYVLTASLYNTVKMAKSGASFYLNVSVCLSTSSSQINAAVLVINSCVFNNFCLCKSAKI